MKVLVDLDNVVAGFDMRFEFLAKLSPRLKDYTPRVRTSFEVTDVYPENFQDEVRQIYTSKGFYRSLPSIPGSVEGVREIVRRGHDVFICTAPLRQFTYCVLEKYQWVNWHLGRDFTDRIIMTKDKTMIHGDVLIDDNPLIKGVMEPSWTHYLFDMPYNRHITDKVRFTWDHVEKYF